MLGVRVPPGAFNPMTYLSSIIFLLTLLGCTISHANMIEQLEELRPSLVKIKTEYQRIYDQKMASYERSGTGIIIDPSGIIVTNTHIIWHAPKVTITLHDGRQFTPKLLYVSQEYDFSLLKIDVPDQLSPITWANTQSATLGETIFAIGNSDIDQSSLLQGNIKALVQNQTNGNIEFIECDLNLHHGDSGGPIFNSNGHLLGMVMAKLKDQDRTSLAIAANKIREQYWKYQHNMP